MGMLLVVITGGIDVSFTALASLSVYVGIDILLRMEYEGSVLVAFLLVAVLSAALAALNWAVYCHFGIAAADRDAGDHVSIPGNSPRNP